LPFEFGHSKTYDTKGNKTVFVKVDGNGNKKRKLTLQLAITADGKPHVRPLVIFAGQEGAAAANRPRRRKEAQEYHPKVDVIFNNKAWCNLKVMLGWFKGQYKWGTPYHPSEREPRLLVLDSFAPHKATGGKQPKKPRTGKTLEKQLAEEQLRRQIEEELRTLNVTKSIIPGGGTAYVQPLDDAPNRIVKHLIREQEEAWIENNLEEWESSTMKLSKRRILMTHWIGNAVKILCRDYQDVIINSFRKVGLSLNPDGSEDHKIKIRDLPGIEVGDWQREPSPDIEAIGIASSQLSCYFANISSFIDPQLQESQDSEPSQSFQFDSQLPPLPFTLRSSAQESHDTYISWEEIENGIINDKGMELEGDITTASEEDTDDLLDSDDDIEFEYDEDDEEIEDLNMD
jgi:hypothetical protein